MRLLVLSAVLASLVVAWRCAGKESSTSEPATEVFVDAGSGESACFLTQFQLAKGIDYMDPRLGELEDSFRRAPFSAFSDFRWLSTDPVGPGYPPTILVDHSEVVVSDVEAHGEQVRFVVNAQGLKVTKPLRVRQSAGKHLIIVGDDVSEAPIGIAITCRLLPG